MADTGYAAGADYTAEVDDTLITDTAATGTAAPAASLLPSRLNRGLLAVVRVGVGLLWLQNVGWKTPPDFGRGEPPDGLYLSASYAVSHEVLRPYAWLIERFVLPNFTYFGWMVLIVGAALGAFLLIGLTTRFWALVGIGQTVAIALSVVNAPHEWYWSYLLMLLVHLALFATAAGRYAGLDGVLRPSWQESRSLAARLLVRLS